MQFQSTRKHRTQIDPLRGLCIFLCWLSLLCCSTKAGQSCKRMQSRQQQHHTEMNIEFLGCFASDLEALIQERSCGWAHKYIS